jgi:hypothetical protein
MCAGATLLATPAFFQHPNPAAIPTVLIGWINPLGLLYLLFCAFKKLHRIRAVLAVIISAACLVMWIQLAREHVTLLVGHYLWIAGIALILLAPLASHLNALDHRARIVT